MRDKKIGKNIVPICPDESRTFGMEGLFRQVGIYAHAGQLYEPVDSDQIAFYKEAKDGQLLEEGINEAGAMSSFIAAGTSYSSHGVNMIPMFIYYSMFGFQRIGDLIWAAADCRAKGFLLGGTAGRTTLNGEGLQHQDGHSLLERDRLPDRAGVRPGLCLRNRRDRVRRPQADVRRRRNVHLLHHARKRKLRHARDARRLRRGHHPRHVQALERRCANAASIACSSSAAARSCAKRCGHRSSWPRSSKCRATSGASPATRSCAATPRNASAGTCSTRTSRRGRRYVEQQLIGVEGPCIASSDYVRALAEQIDPWVPGGLFALGTDGMGRSENRATLRRHFEVDAECITIAALYQLKKQGKCDGACVARAVAELGVDPDKQSALYA